MRGRLVYLLTINERQDNGAYAVLNRYGEKVLFMFEEEDDAERYAIMLNDFADTEVEPVEIEAEPTIKACKHHGYKYTIISPNDIVILPSHYDNLSDD